MQGTPFLIGLAAGAVCATVAWFVLAADPAEAAGPPRAGALTATAPGDDNADLLAEIERLRAELDRRPNSFGRSEAAADEPGEETVEERTAEEVEELLAGRLERPDTPAALRMQIEDLLRELGEVATRADLVDIFLEDPERLVSFLMDVWLQSSTPQRALELMRRFPGLVDAEDYADWISWQLQAMGDNAAARDAALLAIQAGSTEWSIIRRLAELDPQAALTALDSMAPESDEEELSIRSAQRALLQLAAGQSEAAWRAIDQLLESGQFPLEGWTDLLENDPSGAEERLRAALESPATAEDSDQRSYLSARLIESLIGQSRSEEALAAALSHLETAPNDQEVLEYLSDLDSERALTHLAAQVQLNAGDASMWALYGDHLNRAGRRDEAISALWRAIDEDNDYAGQLLRIAPIESAERLVEVARQNDDDELYGDIADALWPQGNHARATELYRLANTLDPTDSEWTGKLRKIAAGLPPF